MEGGPKTQKDLNAKAQRRKGRKGFFNDLPLPGKANITRQQEHDSGENRYPPGDMQPILCVFAPLR
jgi:hypothetical protein